MSFEPGQRISEKLTIIGRLGAGGVGEVWEVEHALTRHRRAMKVLNSRYSGNPQIVERFLREASAAGRIGNAHICETFDAGTLPDGTHYLLMELLKGEPLSARLERAPPPDVLEVVGWIRQACTALAAAHAAGIVHRDLKPDNLFLTRSHDGKPFVKVLDFGISHFDELTPSGERLTQEGSTIGTPRYMSPEQMEGHRVDARTDVYSLGVILYECLALRPPFDATSLAALAMKVSTGDAVPLGEVRPDLPSGLLKLVARAMQVDRTKRFVSVLELGEALADAETNLDPVGDTVARPSERKTEPDTRPDPPAPAPKRRPWWLAALLVPVAAGLGWWLAPGPDAPGHGLVIVVDAGAPVALPPPLDAGPSVEAPQPDAGAAPEVIVDAGRPRARPLRARDAGAGSAIIPDAPYPQ